MSQVVYTPYERLFRDIMKEFDYSTISHETYFTYSSKDSYVIETPLIGISKEELSVRVEEKRLLVETKPTKTSKFVRASNISFSLKDDADVSNISAKLENGLLTVTIPRIRPEKKSVNIKVN